LGLHGTGVSIMDGAALEPGTRLHTSSWPISAKLLSAAAACIAAVALLAALAASTSSGLHPLVSRDGARGHLAIRPPITLVPSASTSIGASERGFWPLRHGAALLTRGGGILSTFTASGAHVRVAGGVLGLALAAVGRGAHVEPTAAVSPTRAASRVVYRRGSVTEFYGNGPYGLEQGFGVRYPPWLSHKQSRSVRAD
jgi:hypothetical protein